ncbi:transposable element Tcb2 transposase [Trichonephila clavipes]|nr:transposable element Tcb2 transposase [Trichonephila clavipes]
MLLDVSMCLVVLFSDFGINTNPKILCPEDLFQADHELQHLQKTVFLALSARRRRTTTVPQLVADHFQASGRRISATTVRNRLHNAGLYARRPVVCVPLNGRQRRNRLCWAREHVSWTQQQWASVLFTDESRFTMESDSGRLLIWREQRTRYHQSNTVERHSYRGGGILVWAGISLGGHTDLHVFHGGTVTGLRYRDETLDPYVRPYAAAIGNDFILMDDNARPHRARIVEEYLEYHGLERMEWPARSPDLNPIEHLWDYLGREVAALNPPPRSLHELKQGLLCVWSSLPIPVSDNLINSMGNRCRQCIQLDYFLWGYVKSLVYADKPQTLDHLEDNIRRVIADIRPQMLEKVIENWTSRLDYIRASRGSPMREIIFKM